MQHGHEPGDFAKARDLSRTAFSLDPRHSTAAWLSAASHDRYLHSIGEPQAYGTQYRRGDPNEPWTMEPFDEDTVADEERTRLGVPTAAESRAQLRMRNELYE